MRRHFTTIKKRACRAVVAYVRVIAISAAPVGFIHHQPVRIAGGKFGPAFHPTGQLFQHIPLMRPDNPRADGLLPPAFGLNVIHHHIRIAQLARHPEAAQLATHATVKHHAGITQRAEGDSHGHTAHLVIHNLVPGQIADRIGTRGLPLYFKGDHRLARIDPFLAGRLAEFRVRQRRNAVLGWATRQDFTPIGDDAAGKIGVWPLVFPTVRVGAGGCGKRCRKGSNQRE